MRFKFEGPKNNNIIDIKSRENIIKKEEAIEKKESMENITSEFHKIRSYFLEKFKEFAKQ